ncbi:hypothetical protein QBC47DRAFT_158150 [Echria macrotheca]|uniref:Uncharacterized protein n=1 Tax=Echria macrotheca TaxID=438768 RepID=A0AAJ0FBN2_9PEZI|nr:hypothetical protein QBC47DRAFT_158150 [Echria macrotheca]
MSNASAAAGCREFVCLETVVDCQAVTRQDTTVAPTSRCKLQTERLGLLVRAGSGLDGDVNANSISPVQQVPAEDSTDPNYQTLTQPCGRLFLDSHAHAMAIIRAPGVLRNAVRLPQFEGFKPWPIRTSSTTAAPPRTHSRPRGRFTHPGHLSRQQRRALVHFSSASCHPVSRRPLSPTLPAPRFPRPLFSFLSFPVPPHRT